MLVEGIHVVDAVLMGLSLKGTTVVELGLLLEGCNGSAICLGGLYAIFGRLFMA